MASRSNNSATSVSLAFETPVLNDTIRNKTCFRTITELKNLMRIDDIKQHFSQDINILEFSTEDKDKLGPVLDWCMKFKTMSSYQYMNGAAY